MRVARRHLKTLLPAVQVGGSDGQNRPFPTTRKPIIDAGDFREKLNTGSCGFPGWERQRNFTRSLRQIGGIISRRNPEGIDRQRIPGTEPELERLCFRFRNKFNSQPLPLLRRGQFPPASSRVNLALSPVRERERVDFPRFRHLKGFGQQRAVAENQTRRTGRSRFGGYPPLRRFLPPEIPAALQSGGKPAVPEKVLQFRRRPPNPRSGLRQLFRSGLRQFQRDDIERPDRVQIQKQPNLPGRYTGLRPEDKLRLFPFRRNLQRRAPQSPVGSGSLADQNLRFIILEVAILQ